MRRSLLPALALFLAGGAEGPVELVFAPEQDTELERTFLAEAEYQLTEHGISMDGKDVEVGELPTVRSSFTERIVVTDTLVAVDGGRPTEFVRTFGELSQESREEGNEEDQRGPVLASPFEGRALRYTFDEDEERYRVEAADEQDLDEDLAEWLAADMDLLLLLPESEVELGDEWQLDPRIYLAFMWPGGLLDFRAEGETPVEDEREMSRQTIERLVGEGTARLDEVRDLDGVRVAVIHVELEIATGSDRVVPASDEEGAERPEVTIEVELERTLEGTILWDIEGGHAHSAELECEASRRQSQAWSGFLERDGSTEEVEVETVSLFRGTIRYTATFVRD
jgi:hypothetical protein